MTLIGAFSSIWPPSAAWRTTTKLLPSSLVATFSASPRWARLRVSSSVFIDSKRVRFSLVARSACPWGSRKLRAYPSLTRTTSPIWPRRPMRCSKITSIARLLRGSGGICAHAGDPPADIEGGVDKPDERDRQGRPSEQHDAEVAGAEDEDAAAERARCCVEHRKTEQHVGGKQARGEHPAHHAEKPGHEGAGDDDCEQEGDPRREGDRRKVWPPTLEAARRADEARREPQIEKAREDRRNGAKAREPNRKPIDELPEFGQIGRAHA